MTSAEYANTRDVFLHALKGVRNVREMLLQDMWDAGYASDAQTPEEWMDETGFWVTSEEMRAMVAAQRVLEALVGRAHARAV